MVELDYEDHLAGAKEASEFWFKARNELIDIILDKSKTGKNFRILNVGAGTGDELEVLKKYGKVYVIDINKDALAMIPENACVEKREADVCDIPYRYNYFDIICAFDVLEHIENDKKAVSEIYRVLKKNGSFIFTVPAFQVLFSSHDAALEHKRRYNAKQVHNLFAGANFNDIAISYWNFFLFLPIAIIRIIKRRSNPKTDHMKLPKILQKLFYVLLAVENKMIKHEIRLPFGISIVGSCKKATKKL